MAGFTDEEIQAAVDRFLYKQIQTPRLKTGARDVLTARDRVFDLLTTALLLRPDAYFYVVHLAKNRLSALLTQQIAALDAIIEAAPNTTRAAKRIETTAELANAQAALLDLTAGLNQRTTGIRGSIGPSVDRFRRSISSFVSTELSKNVVVAGVVTETGAELRDKIASLWADSTSRHPDIVELAESISSALITLESVRLPESSVRDIVQRIQDRLTELRTTLEGTSAISRSRESMLELLTMRTLLTKASTFRNPDIELMPGRGDTSQIAPIDSTGIEAKITGAVSGPFNYAPGVSFDFELNGVPVSLALPRAARGSRAELRSKAFSPWVAPTISDEAAFVVDLGGTVSFVLAGAYASGPLAAAALDAGLGPSIEVSWDASTSQLVFQSADDTDASDLKLLFDSAPRTSFRDWAFPVADVFRTYARGEPVPTAEIVRVITEGAPTAEAVAETTPIASFRGERSSVIGEEDILWNRIDTGTDATTDSADVISSPSKNFKTLGVKPGMAIHISAPAVADYSILAVDGSSITVDALSLPAGPLTYYIGPDHRAVPAGARVRITSGASLLNSGFYRVVSGGVAGLVLDRDIPVADTGLISSVYTEYLTIKARGTSTAQSIGVLSGSAGATAMGFAVTADAARPSLTGFQLQGSGDFLLRGVKVGDTLVLTNPAGGVTNCEIEELTATTVKVVDEDAQPYDGTGAWGYAVLSSRGAAYQELASEAVLFLAEPLVSKFSTIDTFVGRIIRGARYTGEIQAGIEAYRAALVAMLQACAVYSVPFERTIDGVVKTMREQGFDRALDLMVTLRIDELFSMDPDGVSYSSWLVRNAATAAREVTPVSKYARSQNIIQEWRPVSYQPNPFDPRGEGSDS